MTINRILFKQKRLPYIQMMNEKSSGKGSIMAITHPNAMVAIPLVCHDVIITTACTVNKGVINVEENKSWEIFNIHAVPLIRYMGTGTECLQKESLQ